MNRELLEQQLSELPLYIYDFFDPRTLESRLVPGLFACGELLDVDGDCGGYNLQWAWSSGRLAGESAGKDHT